MDSRSVSQRERRPASVKAEAQAAERVATRPAVLGPRWLLGGMIAAYVLFLSFGASIKYYYWGQGFDYVDYYQAIWNTVQGRPLGISRYNFTDTFLGIDFTPGLFFAVPFYMLWPSPYMLNILQSVLLALGAVPVYLIARDRFTSERAGLAWAASYLLYPTLHFVNMTPAWQPRTLAILTLLWAFRFFQQGKRWSFFLALAVAITTRTDVSLVVFAFGLYALLQRRGWRWAVPPLLVGLLWFYVSISIITPSFYLPDYRPQETSGTVEDYTEAWPGSNPSLSYYAHLGKDPVDIIKNIITHPVEVAQLVFTAEKLSYLFLMFGTLLFLPLFAPKELLLTAPIFAVNLLSTRIYQYTIKEQYQALIIPGIVIAGIFGAARLWEWYTSMYPGLRRRATLLLIGQVLLIGVLHLPLRNPVISQMRNHEDPARVAVMERMAELIPADARVASTSFLAPHLMPRQHLYYLPNDPAIHPPMELAEYAFIDTRAQVLQGTGLVDRLHSDPNWELIHEEDELILFKQTREP